MKKKILVVDNDPLIGELLTDLLQQEGHEVVVAEDGISALDTLASFIPDIMFIDLIMPRISGEKLCQVVQSMPHLKDCYLVIISAAMAEQEIDFLKTGANAYLAKKSYSEMRENIFAIIRESDQIRSGIKEKSVMGLDDVHPRQMTKELLLRNRHLEIILESMSEGVLEVYLKKIVYANSAAISLLGLLQERLLGSYPPDLFDKFVGQRVEALLKSGTDESSEIGPDMPVEINGRLLTMKKLPLKEDASTTIILIMDVTEQKREEDRIKASLREKEVLLREIHHRVNNNMQVITSLLRLQSEQIKEEKYAGLFQDSVDRIRSMALVHERLYQSKDLTNVDFKEYIKTLVSFLFRFKEIDTNKITPRIEVEGVSLNIETAIPCALVINELITNSLKHAFPGERKGELKISLRSIGEDALELIVRDNGIGMPEDLDFRTTESFGMDLIRILGEDQLDGQVELDRTAGTKFHIRFKRQKYEPRI